MKKKIIFVTQALWIGGIETALTNLLRQMDYEKYDVTLLILRKHLHLADRLPKACRLLVADREQEGYRYLRLFRLTEEATNPSFLHRMFMWLVPGIRWVENRLFIRYVRRLLGQERFDTAVIYSDVTAETVVRAVRAEKYLLFYHHGAMRKVYHDTIGYRKSEKIITVSQGQREMLKAFRPEYAEKITTIHNVTDVEAIQKKAMAFPVVFDPDAVHILSCGRLHEAKGMDLAVEACGRLVEMGHTNIRWHIIGGGPEEQTIREKIAALGVGDYVNLMGMQENPYPYIGAADLYVQPSRFEAYPMTVLEALILGKPVISTDNAGAREILTPGENGILCGISAEDIANAVADLLEHPEKKRQLEETVGAMDLERGNRNIITQLEALF